MKLYTRTGDDGTTGLFGGRRVTKHHPRVVAYGEVDELNAAIGLALAACESGSQARQEIGDVLRELQSRLFDLGADLATPPGDKHETKVRRVAGSDVEQAERWIDAIDDANAPLTSFILPGGSELAARLHLARTICRRTERAVIAMREEDEAVSDAAIMFLNRISDLLFAMARRANADASVADVPWVSRT